MAIYFSFIKECKYSVLAYKIIFLFCKTGTRFFHAFNTEVC